MDAGRLILRHSTKRLRRSGPFTLFLALLLATVPALAQSAVQPAAQPAATGAIAPAADALPLIVIGPKLRPVPAPLPADQPELPPARYMNLSPSPPPAYLSFLDQPQSPLPEPSMAVAPAAVSLVVQPQPERTIIRPGQGLPLTAPISIAIGSVSQGITVFSPSTVATDGGVTFAIPPEPAKPAFTKDQTLVLGIKVNKILMEEFVDGIVKDRRIYLSLSSLVSALEFPITINTSDHTARGWFIRERNNFSLKENTAKVAGETYALSDTDILYQDDDIYVAQDILTAWFGLQFSIEPLNMMLSIASDKPLPFEEKLRRQQRMALSGSGLVQRDFSGYVPVETPYTFYEFPYVDVNISPGFDTSLTKRFSSAYSVVTQGDFAHLTTNIFLAGDLADNPLTQARLLFGRQDESRQLLGALKASEFEFGDISATSLALVADSQQGRGFSVTNRSLYRTDQFDVTTFRGNAPPGWDVELYRNDALLELQSVGADGQYEFLNIPIYFGQNTFRIVLYGPEGQIQEETKEYYTGSTLLGAGEFTYNFSVADAGHSLLGISDNTAADTAGLRLLGEIEYGINKWFTVTAGAAQLQQEDGDHQYVTGGMRASALGILGSADVAFDPGEGTTAGRVTLATSIYDINMRLQQAWYNGLISDENSDPAHLLTQATSLDLDTDVTLIEGRPTNLGLGVTRKEYETGSGELVIKGRISQQIFGLNASNTLEKTISDTNERLTDNLTLRGSAFGILYGASLDYNLEPTMDMQQLSLNAQFRPFTNMVNRTAIQIFPDESFNYTNTLTLDRRKYGLSFILGGDSDRNYFVGMGLNFSFTRLPGVNEWQFQNRSMTDSGGAVLRSFIDKNGNNTRDEDEPYVEGVKYTRNGSQLGAPADKDYAFTSQLTPNTPVNLGIDPNSIKDPTLAPANPGVVMLPRRGHTAVIDFPLYESAQLEGTIYQTAGDQKNAAAHVNIELRSADGTSVAAVQSEFDGYYLFNNVRPGSYVLHAQSALEGAAAELVVDRPITLNGADFITADLTLEQK